MVAAGVNVDSMAQGSGTGVSMAASFGLPRILATLLEAGASPHLTGIDSPTPLQYAVVERRPECLALLLAAGVDPKEAYQEPTSVSANMALRERLCQPFRQGAAGTRVCQMLAVAPAFAARSWAWPSTATENEEGGAIKQRETADGVVGRPKVNAASVHVLWVSRRRGSALNSMLRRVDDGGKKCNGWSIFWNAWTLL